MGDRLRRVLWTGFASVSRRDGRALPSSLRGVPFEDPAPELFEVVPVEIVCHVDPGWVVVTNFGNWWSSRVAPTKGEAILLCEKSTGGSWKLMEAIGWKVVRVPIRGRVARS